MYICICHFSPRPTSSETECVCPYPYTGRECEIHEQCNVNPCVHGTCYVDEVYGTESHCLCDENWIRDPITQVCTTELCSNGEAFCMNGGGCNAAGTGCDCPDNAAGAHCEDSTLAVSFSFSNFFICM